MRSCFSRKGPSGRVGRRLGAPAVAKVDSFTFHCYRLTGGKQTTHSSFSGKRIAQLTSAARRSKNLHLWSSFGNISNCGTGDASLVQNGGGLMRHSGTHRSNTEQYTAAHLRFEPAEKARHKLGLLSKEQNQLLDQGCLSASSRGLRAQEATRRTPTPTRRLHGGTEFRSPGCPERPSRGDLI